MGIDDPRLTESDWTQIRTRIVDYLAWCYPRRGDTPLRPTDTLRRLAYNSIGCGSVDLRDSELELIDKEIDKLLDAHALKGTACRS